MARAKDKVEQKAHDAKEDVKLPLYLNTRTLTSHLCEPPAEDRSRLISLLMIQSTDRTYGCHCCARSYG